MRVFWFNLWTSIGLEAYERNFTVPISLFRNNCFHNTFAYLKKILPRRIFIEDSGRNNNISLIWSETCFIYNIFLLGKGRTLEGGSLSPYVAILLLVIHLIAKFFLLSSQCKYEEGGGAKIVSKKYVCICELWTFFRQKLNCGRLM